MYVYALLGSEPRELPHGGAESPLRTVQCGDLTAAVASTEGQPLPNEENILRHDRIVRELASMVDAILPARFGSTVADERILAELLSRRGPELRRALDLVKGREQMTLRIYGEPSARQDTEQPVIAGGPGARYLMERKREGETLIPGLEALRSGLELFVRAESVQRHHKPPLVASVYHLIERERSEAYLAALDRVTQSLIDCKISASGPWPPYAFGRWEAS